MLSSAIVICALSLPLQNPTPSDPQPAPEPQPVDDVRINEVLFDPLGAAGTAGAYPFVELYFGEATSTEGLVVENQDATVQIALPALSMPAGSYLVVLFGPSDPDMENLDVDAGPISVTTGHPWGDHLGVTDGGVRVRRNDRVLDQIHWGLAPGGHTPFFDLSFATGSPISEGDSIGRNRNGRKTGAASDFAVAGGVHAMGMTPGERNVVDMPDEADLLYYQENLVNGLLSALSLSYDNTGWLQVEGTAPVVTYFSSGGDQATISVQHAFDVVIDGLSVQLAGLATTTFTRDTTAGATSELYTSSGLLESPVGPFALSFDVSRGASGAHALQQLVDYTTSYTWTHWGTDYSAEVSGTRTTQRVAQDTVHLTDLRSASDWGGLDKSATADATIARLGDGNYRASSTVERTFPSQLPYPGSDQSWSSETETLVEELETVVDGLGQLVSGTVTAYSQSVGNTLFYELRPGEVGTLSTSHAIDFTSGTQTATTTAFYPLRSFGSPTDLQVVSEATLDDTSGKELTTGTISASRDGWPVASFDFAVDPPLPAQGQGNKSLGKKIGDAAFTAATCVGAGVAGQISVETRAGKRAMIRMFGKGLAKKLIPGVGWATTAYCAGKGIWNEFF